jgi:cytochrome c551/c552
MRILGIVGTAVTLAVVVQGASASEDTDRTMLKLARERGCLVCHAFQPDDSAVAKVLPPAPTFREIAQRYKGIKDADKQLVKTVLQGTGPHPGDRHWAGKVNAPDRMLPNAVEVEPHEARALVHWILALDR